MMKCVEVSHDLRLAIQGPTLQTIFRNKDKIATACDSTPTGIVVTQTSNDAETGAALQKHASEVTDLVKRGMVAAHETMMRNTGGGKAALEHRQGPRYKPRRTKPLCVSVQSRLSLSAANTAPAGGESSPLRAPQADSVSASTRRWNGRGPGVSWGAERFGRARGLSSPTAVTPYCRRPNGDLRPANPNQEVSLQTEEETTYRVRGHITDMCRIAQTTS